jgi:hypothetical protein
VLATPTGSVETTTLVLCEDPPGWTVSVNEKVPSTDGAVKVAWAPSVARVTGAGPLVTAQA